MPDSTWFESLGQGPGGEPLTVCVSRDHSFGADAFLLAGFAGGKPGDRAADLGSGCGILPVLLYKMYRCKEIYGLEIQKPAVELFRTTVSACGLNDRIFPVEGDLRRPPETFPKGCFDLVICNPPYFRGSPSPDPARAAARTETACTLEEVCAAAARLLRFGGRFCLCQRPERLPELFAAMTACNLTPKRLRLAADSVSAPPWLALVEGRLGGRPGLRAEPLFAARNPDGTPTDEMNALYQKARTL